MKTGKYTEEQILGITRRGVLTISGYKRSGRTSAGNGNKWSVIANLRAVWLMRAGHCR